MKTLAEIAADPGASRWVPVWTGKVPARNAGFVPDFTKNVRAEDVTPGTPVFIVGGGTPVAVRGADVLVISIGWRDPGAHDRVLQWAIDGKAS